MAINNFISLPCSHALIKTFHASHHMKGLLDVPSASQQKQAQGFMGLRQRKLRSALEILCRSACKIRLFLANRGFSTVWGLFSLFFFK
jgi:hypothetical protein